MFPTLNREEPNSVGTVFSYALSMKTFRTLELSEKFYHQTETLKLNGNLRDQMTRASSSIALNLAEGNAKPSVKEKRRYYQTAYASLKECQSILRLAK